MCKFEIRKAKDELQVVAALQAMMGQHLAIKKLATLICREFAKCVAKIRNLCMLQLPPIGTFILHFGDINKGHSDSMEVP